ncbi:YlaF family protein [Bacillus massiliglaciei]|uniref:YlaF family protein n=1 Tax=Bacillus massiliglaciei TaxID=1816693 RepID=UPI002D218515|nr:YlaF family protein [Bacillus massiliglaciei]
MNIKWDFLLLAVLATIAIGSIGVFIAVKSWIGALAAVALIIFIMGFGFTRKKKLRESGKL